jgi:signal transduction histidine kinase
MAEQAILPEPSFGSPFSKSSIIDDLFDLTVSRDLEVMLGKALRMTIGLLTAEAGSAFFQVHSPPQTVRSGAFRQEALDWIQRWEEAVGRRIQETDANIPKTGPIPVSVFKLKGSQLLLVNIPLVHDTKLVGSLSFILPPGRELANNHRQLLERLARGLGQMAALVAELELAQHRLHQISLFYDVGQALVTTFDITKLLTETMELATNVIDAGAASILLIDEERHELVFKVSHGTRGPMVRQQRIPLEEGIGGWVARTGKPVIANNARADSRFSNRVDVRTGFLTQSIAAVPLKIKGQIIGVLEVLNKYSGSGFTQEDIQLMSYIATQAAIAIENARLYEKLREERDQIIQTQEDFRREIIRNLQDGPVHLLSAISMGLDHLERLSDRANPEVLQNEISALRNLIRQATQDASTLLFDLHPIVLENKGLKMALEQYVNQLRHANDFTIHFKILEEINYDSKVSRAIFSIVHEAIGNIKRHAHANNVWLSLEVRRGRFVVTIKDDGQGFEVNRIDTTKDRHMSFGVFNMRERAILIGAELQIESQAYGPNRGTTVQLTLPWLSGES